MKRIGNKKAYWGRYSLRKEMLKTRNSDAYKEETLVMVTMSMTTLGMSNLQLNTEKKNRSLCLSSATSKVLSLTCLSFMVNSLLVNIATSNGITARHSTVTTMTAYRFGVFCRP